MTTTSIFIEGRTITIHDANGINTFTYNTEIEAQLIYDATLASLQERSENASEG